MEKDNKPQVKKSEAGKEHGDSLVENVTWRHYSFFIIHFMQSILGAVSFPPMRQYLYAKIAIEKIKNTTYAINSTFDMGGNSLCRSENISSDRERIQEQIQTETATWTLYFNLAVGIPQILMLFYLGYLADMIGRKPLILLNNFGYVIRLAMYAIVIHWDLPTGYILIGNILDGLTGSYTGSLQLTNIYTADVTKKGKMRGFILTVIYCLTDVFYGVVNISAGYIMKKFGFFVPIFFSAAALFVLNLMFYVITPETLERKSKLKDLSPTKGIRSVLSFYRHTTEKNDWRTRVKFWLCLISFTMINQVVIGKWDLTPLFALNSPFCWTSVELGHFNGGTLVIQAPLTISILYILQRFFTHEVIAVFGLISLITENLIWAFSSEGWMLYLASAVGAVGTLSALMIRTIVSHLTDPREQGSVFAGLGTVEALCGMTSTAMLTTVYTHTISWMKGFTFIVVASFFVIPVILLLILHYMNKKESAEKPTEISIEEIPKDTSTELEHIENTGIVNTVFQLEEKL